ncbi:fucose isomerase [Thalassobacillus devorans]|uniref:Fucose isomerase n=1 Tax=Thalassobacillus devorans TaxID=279813 RepID=A0ABQ1NUX8_9BACI|nr:hypothetical protein [Thalassobacillus devorans]NIK28559.1 L-fucose isomerase-like protein [Thalassobacillus devorans]GGC85284.1 fucose isomerase [Thalassobacillus devorans]
MNSSSVLYLPIGRPTFDMEAAEEYYEQSKSLLSELAKECVEPGEIITSPEALEEYLSDIHHVDVDIIIYQSVTFADAQFVKLIQQKRNEPFIVWSVREPSVGGRLRLNSLTGGNSTCHSLKNAGRHYRFLLGNPDETNVSDKLSLYLQTEALVKELSGFTIGVVGEHQPGFYFSDANDEQLRELLGIQIHRLSLEEAFAKAKEMPEEKWSKELALAQEKVMHLNEEDPTVTNFSRFSSYMRTQIRENNLNALAIRCWPEFFNELGAAACSTLSHFTEEGVVSSCEADIHGAISMHILQSYTGGPPYLGDLVHVNEENNSVTFWHCGAAAYSLANERTGAVPGVHPNRKLGFTMEFGLKAGDVTISRLSHVDGEYRLFVMTGKALDTPQQFNGTSVEVQLEEDCMKVLNDLMGDGLEPHYAVGYGQVKEDIIDLAHRLGIETIVYS